MNLQEEWNHTCKHLEWLKNQFISLHNTSQKDWTQEQHNAAYEYRESARDTAQHRYYILSLARKEGLKIK